MLRAAPTSKSSRAAPANDAVSSTGSLFVVSRRSIDLVVAASVLASQAAWYSPPDVSATVVSNDSSSWVPSR